MQAIVDAGFDPTYMLLFDEIWAFFAHLSPAMVSVLVYPRVRVWRVFNLFFLASTTVTFYTSMKFGLFVHIFRLPW